MSGNALPRSRTAGGQLLGQADKQQAIADVLGVSRQLVGHWRNGLKLPTKPQRKKLLEHYGIPVDAWTKPPATVVTPPPAPVANVEAASGSPDDGTGDLVDDLVARARRGLARVDANPAATERERALALLAAERALRLRVMAEPDEAKLVRSPVWRRKLEIMRAALEPHPEAAAALATALREARLAS